MSSEAWRLSASTLQMGTHNCESFDARNSSLLRFGIDNAPQHLCQLFAWSAPFTREIRSSVLCCCSWREVRENLGQLATLRLSTRNFGRVATVPAWPRERNHCPLWFHKEPFVLWIRFAETAKVWNALLLDLLRMKHNILHRKIFCLGPLTKAGMQYVLVIQTHSVDAWCLSTLLSVRSWFVVCDNFLSWFNQCSCHWIFAAPRKVHLLVATTSFSLLVSRISLWLSDSVSISTCSNVQVIATEKKTWI